MTEYCHPTMTGFLASPVKPIRAALSPQKLHSSSSPVHSPTKRCGTPDRFIPKRDSRDLALRHYLLTCSGEVSDSNMSPAKRAFNDSLARTVLNESPSSARILSFQSPKKNKEVETYEQTLRCLHRKRDVPVLSELRTIPQNPEIVLDCPDIVDDYYLNLLDWNSNNILAIALGNAVYLWNGETKETNLLVEYEDDIITSLAWHQGSRFLSVGTQSAEIQIYDTEAVKRVRTLTGHLARVSSLSWNDHIVSSGGRDSNIINHDVRVRSSRQSDLSAHTQEVCGLKWSPSGHTLASGGNDNILHLWDIRQSTRPQYAISEHQAAVKALAWCPWQSNLLASGGGTADKTLRFWNTNTGACVNSIETGSQVCSIVWSKEYKELVSSHGYSENQLIVWKYPTLTKVSEFKAHSKRVLHMALSPDGTTVCSAAGDETLRFWKLFPKSLHPKSTPSSPARRTLFDANIR